MGKLTVNFNGICTHFPAGHLTSIGVTLADSSVQWRVLLVQNVNGRRYQSDANGPKSVPPHEASMVLGQSRIAATLGALSGLRQITPASYLLRGVQITVANPVTPQAFQTLPDTPPYFDDIIPSLHEYAQPPGSLPANLTLSPRMVGGESAAAYFDITCGTLTARYLGDAADEVAHVVYEVNTIGSPRLNVHTFYDGTTSVLDFADDEPSIIIQNVGEQKDSFYDFTLHYLVCSDIPSTIVPPGSDTHVDALGSGCSNSQWP